MGNSQARNGASAIEDRAGMLGLLHAEDSRVTVDKVQSIHLNALLCGITIPRRNCTAYQS